MTTRSATSSLIGPPTTVDEDGGSMVGDLPYHDENLPNWNSRRVSPRRANDAMFQGLDDFAMSPKVERVLKGFHEELDSLSKSFDVFFSQKKDRSQLESASSIGTPHLSHISTAKRSAPLREKDPPPTVGGASPLRPYIHSTPARRSGSASYTPSEPPPAPVETPGFGFPTPNRERTRRTTTAPRPDDSSSKAHREPASASRLEESFLAEKNDQTAEELRKIIKEQASRIQDLEIENEVLRKKLKLQLPTVERVHRSSPLAADPVAEKSNKGRELETPPRVPSVRRTTRLDRPEPEARASDRVETSSVLPEEPEGRHHPTAASSPFRTQASYLSSPGRSRQPLVEQRESSAGGPPRHIHTLTEAIDEVGDAFTPGTRFVSQLATLMKIEESHCVPLSLIIDKHWDKLQHHFDQSGSRNQYDR